MTTPDNISVRLAVQADFDFLFAGRKDIYLVENQKEDVAEIFDEQVEKKLMEQAIEQGKIYLACNASHRTLLLL